MSSKIAACLLTLLAFSSITSSQQPAASPPAEDVVKITTNLVQFDAVVTDKNGKQVTNLTANDFVILQDGKPQKITNFSYVNTDVVPGAAGAQAQSSAIPGAPPPVRQTYGGTGRIVTFVIDDGNCRASQIGVAAAREGVERFIKEQMAPTDMVAVYRTRSGSSVFQQYTSDKEQLLKVVSKIRWLPPQLGCAANDGSFYDAATVNSVQVANGNGGERTVSFESEAERKIREAGEDSKRDDQVVGTIGVLRYVVRGLERVSGRKVIFFMSDGLPFRGRDGKPLDAVNALRDLTDMANRSSVVFNTIDARGLINETMIEARDRVSTVDNAVASEAWVADRRTTVRDSRHGLEFLAEQTGGEFYKDQNMLDVPVKRAMSLEKGYYLLAYEPDDDAFKGKKFNKIEIRSTRPDLRVQSRAGFIGETREPQKRKSRSQESDLYDAIAAPLPTAGLNLRLTAFFGNTPDAGTFVRSLVHVDGADIKFVDDAQGRIKAVFDVVAVTMNEKNEVVDEFTRTHTFKIEAPAASIIRQNGLVYTTDVPIKKPGVYSFRVAVRDATTRMLGSASQVVQIPDLKKGELQVSALTVSEVDKEGKFAVPSAVKPEFALSLSSTPAVPAIRRFRRGTILAYSYAVYNAKIGPGGRPALSVQMNLYRDGKLIVEGKPAPADLPNQTDWSRIQDYTYFRLTPDAARGDYTLQVIVRDTLAKGVAVASQSVDFEVEG